MGIKACAAGPQELRKQLLDLVDSFGRLGGKNQSAVDDIEDALSALLSSRGSDSSSSLLANDLDPSLTAGWEERLEGRWNLRYSTEGPLLQLMTNQALPFLSTGQVYQLFRGDGTLQVGCQSLMRVKVDQKWRAITDFSCDCRTWSSLIVVRQARLCRPF